MQNFPLYANLYINVFFVYVCLQGYIYSIANIRAALKLNLVG